MNNNPILLFLKETLLRLTAKSPRYFQVLQWIAGAIVLIMALPETLHYFGVELSISLTATLNKIVEVATKISLLIPFLAAQSPATAVEADGTVLKKTNEKKLPFTAKIEEAQAKKLPVNDLKVVGEIKPQE